MKKPKNHSADFKARVALEAIREELTLSELAKKYGVHANQISTWKRAALDNMPSAFERRGRAPDAPSSADIEKLHSKIGQLVVERDFLANGLPCKPPSVRGAGQTINCSGREAKNGEQGSQAEYAPPVRAADVVALQFVL